MGIRSVEMSYTVLILWKQFLLPKNSIQFDFTFYQFFLNQVLLKIPYSCTNELADQAIKLTWFVTNVINNHACSCIDSTSDNFSLQVESASVNLCVNRPSRFTDHELLHVKHTEFVWSSMWNSTAIHDHWGFTCESSRETPCEVNVKMCELVACEISDLLPFSED